MAGDLHNHSTCSDGSTPIHRLAAMAARAGLDALALSDHDPPRSAGYLSRPPGPAPFAGHRRGCDPAHEARHLGQPIRDVYPLCIA